MWRRRAQQEYLRVLGGSATCSSSQDDPKDCSFEYTPGDDPKDDTAGRNIEPKAEYVFAFCEGECFYCGRKLKFNKRQGNDDDVWEIDHMHPHSRGGLNTYFNLVVACKKCNRDKSDKTAREFGSVRCEGFTKENRRCKNNIAPGNTSYCSTHGSGKK